MSIPVKGFISTYSSLADPYRYKHVSHIHLMAHPFTFQIESVGVASEVASYCNCSLTSLCFVVCDIN